MLAALSATAASAEERGLASGPVDRGTEYEISAAGRPIGTYGVTLQGPDGNGRYQLRARFAIRLGGLLKTADRLATDQVGYDGEGLRLYRIDEDAGGVRTTVKGERSADGRRLMLLLGTERKEVEWASFDLSLFGLRFPRPGAAGEVGRRTTLRLLAPRTGNVVSVHSVLAEFGPRRLGDRDVTVCVFITYDGGGTWLKESWLRSDGVMLYEKAAEYSLTLRREGPAALLALH
jgi:hypothetical protein